MQLAVVNISRFNGKRANDSIVAINAVTVLISVVIDIVLPYPASSLSPFDEVDLGLHPKTLAASIL